jgi:tRNA-specific 2-thiouridylase
MNSLGFDKDPSRTRVVVAMSGGVDSSVAAALLKEQGYDVVGITLQLYDHGDATKKVCAPSAGPAVPSGTEAARPPKSSKTCCAGADIYDARQVAAQIGIPHYVLDYESAFRQSVMDDFADSYLRGETPIPCVRCNQKVKFRDLLTTARDLGADCLATGHYAQRIMGNGGAELHAGADPARDQSYFLFTTTREQLDYLRFPLGGISKSETRLLAEKYALPVAEKPDSQDICFVPNGKYADVVAKMRPGAIDPGDIVDRQGNVLGRHEGIIHFTIGQRKGLNLQALGGEQRAPLFVLALDAAKKQVIVGPHEALAVQQLALKDINWLADPATLEGAAIEVRCRSAMLPVEARLNAAADDKEMFTIELAAAQHGIAPGQACVMYKGNRVIGGGWISGKNKAALLESPAKSAGSTTLVSAA